MRVFLLSYMRAAMVAAVLMVVVGLALAAPPKIVYRGTDEPPERVFRDGLRSRGTSNDFYEHVAGNACTDGTTGFVSTTEAESQAHHFAFRRLIADDSLVYVYEIRATDSFYSTEITLRDAFNRLRDPRFRAAIERFRGEHEWLAFGGVPTELIPRVQIYRRNPTTRLAELVETRQNENYRHEDTVANSQPYPIDRRPRTSVVVVSPSLFGASSTSCLCNISEEAEKKRRKRAAEGHTPACAIFSIAADDMKTATVVDPITGSRVQRYVPWVTRKQTRGYATTEAPIGCEFVKGDAPLQNLLAVKCAGMSNVRHYQFLMGAGGPAKTWVSTAFRGGVVGEWFGRTNKQIPVVDTRNSLADYGYSVYDVFGNSSGNWWSALTVLPVYPALPYKESSVCFYRRTNYRDRLFCLPSSGSEERLTGGNNDAIVSIEAPTDHRYQICEHHDFGGRCHILSGNSSATDLRRLGMNYNISSVRACYKPPANILQSAPNNKGLIGDVYFNADTSSGKREYFRLKRSTYGPFPSGQKGNADWTYLPDYDEC